MKRSEVVGHLFYGGNLFARHTSAWGEVVTTWEHPRARDLDGRKCRVPGGAVRWLPPEVANAIVRQGN